MSGSKLQIEIDHLKKDVFSDDWELVQSSIKRLREIGGYEVIDFLVILISSDNSGLRNYAALALEEIKDNRALEPLLKSIFKKENHNYNGTMVFALTALDCSQKLKEIFKILFYETYESKISAYAILCDQIFDFTKDDIIEIKNMWEDCVSNPSKCPCFDDEDTKAMMQDAVDGFMAYLKE